jgi:hypothetical protein
MGGRNIERYVVDADRVGLGVTYGPARDADGYVLTSITDGERVAWDWSKRQPVTESQREVERAVADVEGD